MPEYFGDLNNMQTADLLKIVGLCKLINRAIHYEPLLEQIITYCTEVMDVEGASVLLHDPKRDKLIFHLVTGNKSEKIKKIILSCNEGIAGWIFKNNVSIISNNIPSDPRFCDRVDKSVGFVTKSIIGVPLVLDETVIGVFELVNRKHTDGFLKSDLVLAEGMAAQIALAIERTRLIQENIIHNRLVAIGEAIASLAHHIKNILTGFEGAAKLIRDALPCKKYDIVEKMWAIVDKSTARISALTKNMLELSKDRIPHYSLNSINKIIGEITDLYSQKAKMNNLTIESSLDENIPDFYFDAEGIYRCLLNLVSNGFDAVAKTECPKITIKSRIHNTGKSSKVIIETIDNGCGISEEVLEKLMMSKFFSTKGSSGTGLGLHVVRKIVNEHNGNLDIKSVCGEGSVFTISLPLVLSDPGENLQPK